MTSFSPREIVSQQDRFIVGRQDVLLAMAKIQQAWSGRSR
jgi:ATP-dependent protease HslVU (ClpYQ) ATPase subunit